jgi:hypothetical protein
MDLIALWTEARDARARYLALAREKARDDASVSQETLTAAANDAVLAEYRARDAQIRSTWTEWRAPARYEHVWGKWTARVIDPDTGMPEPQKVTMGCRNCGQEWQTTCASGHVQSHIQKFAVQHLHADVFGYVPRKGLDE